MTTEHAPSDPNGIRFWPLLFGPVLIVGIGTLIIRLYQELCR